MAFKNVNNCGVSDSDLVRGFCECGPVPEEYSDLTKVEAEAAKEAKHEREERAMAKKFGWDVPEEFGGFLGRDFD